MASTVKILRCFIASPSDTKSERSLCDEVFQEINHEIGNLFGFRLESLKWENDTYPDFGEDAQDVINKQIGNRYDIFVGIMWGRFGTSTSREDSGTEEEFKIAYERLKGKNGIHIFFYFNGQSINFDSIDPEQISKVKAFKASFADLGGYYATYCSSEDFRKKLKSNLCQYLRESHSVQIEKSIENTNNMVDALNKDNVLRILDEKLNEALTIFPFQPYIWIEPRFSKKSEISQDPDKSEVITFEELSLSREPIIIKASPQFGLTCLSHALIKEKWKKLDEYWIYFDAETVKPHEVKRAIAKNLSLVGICIENVKGFVLDSWCIDDKKHQILLNNICTELKALPFYVMQRINNNKTDGSNFQLRDSRTLSSCYLMSLTKAQIRSIVSSYNNEKHIGDEDKILSRVVMDMKALNIHRTPYNCLTLLKVSEKYFDESPINRTKMLEMVLFVLFNLDDVPTYKSKPDVRDCEQVLGVFCEMLIRDDRYEFTRDEFIRVSIKFCKENFLSVEVDVVFDVLKFNNILVERDAGFGFKFTYWVFYFGAHRMRNDASFKDYIFSSQRYLSFPSIIEFYTGIDRNREDAIVYLKNELMQAVETVDKKIGLPFEINPYKSAHWNVTNADAQNMTKELERDIKSSNLPAEVIDSFTDRFYDRSKPYDQTVHNVLKEYSVFALMQQIKSCSVALRNSDYIKPELKLLMIEQIFRGWEQFSKVIFALSPILASSGIASIDGASFVLAGTFADSFEERLKQITLANPTNILAYFKDELTSGKMGPLIFEYMRNTESMLIKHEIALFCCVERPKNWEKVLSEYIRIVPKNSFYLFDIFRCLRSQYRYSYATKTELDQIAFLIKSTIAKHELGTKDPGTGAIKRVKDSVIPKRFDDETIA